MNSFELRPQIKYFHNSSPISCSSHCNTLTPYPASVLDEIMDEDGNFYVSLDTLDYNNEPNDSIVCNCWKCGPYLESSNDYSTDDYNTEDYGTDDIPDDTDTDITVDNNTENNDDSNKEDPEIYNHLTSKNNDIKIISTTYEKLIYIKPQDDKKFIKSEVPLTENKNTKLLPQKQKIMGKWANGTKNIRENPFVLKIVKKEILTRNTNININNNLFEKDVAIMNKLISEPDEMDDDYY